MILFGHGTKSLILIYRRIRISFMSKLFKLHLLWNLETRKSYRMYGINTSTIYSFYNCLGCYHSHRKRYKIMLGLSDTIGPIFSISWKVSSDIHAFLFLVGSLYRWPNYSQIGQANDQSWIGSSDLEVLF